MGRQGALMGHEGEHIGNPGSVLQTMRALIDRRRRRRRPVPLGVRTPRIAIIGAGAAGICTAVRLQQAGIDSFVIHERGEAVGGTWRDNTYPGAACDVPSHLYCFSFRHKRDWTRRFAPQAEILQYLEDVVDQYGLRRHLRLRSGVAAASWDDARRVWVITLESGETTEAEILVSGVGQLNRPNIPDIEGLLNFHGPMFHSARWDHEVDLEDRDVAVIGTGASAIQFVPEIAPRVRRLTLLQRSPNWVGPKSDRAYSPMGLRIFTSVPGAAATYRRWTYASFELRFLWMRQGSRFARLVQQRLTDAIGPLVSPRLPREALVPDYPLGCKRILISNDWYPTLLRPNVEVVTEPIEAVGARWVRAGGVEIPAEVLILATGFTATEFLSPMRLTGRGGVTLEEAWPQGAEAYLGMCVPGFPNLFLLYGPNTNLGHNSIIFMIERQVDYLVDCVRHLIDAGASDLEVRPEAMAQSTAALEDALAGTVWEAGCSSWYKTAGGRVVNNWPAPTFVYWWRTLAPRWSDFAIRRREPQAVEVPT